MRRTMVAVMMGILLTGGGWVAGQHIQQTPPYGVPMDPRILSGSNIGFRVDGKTPEGVTGTLMVRLKNGEWVEAHSSPWRGRVVPLETK